MSGITGIFIRKNAEVNNLQIETMNDYLSHRGPNGSKIWLNGPLGMGHQMLHTTPESLHENLPFEDPESGIVITADARIDNREELAVKLKIDNDIKTSDSIFILRAYQKWGEECPKKLLGDFAFAIWDPEKKHLFCARDHMGVKPFYYYLSDDYFVFASEIKSILSNDNISNKISDLKIADYITPLHQDREITFYENIFRLPAAHILTVKFKEVLKRSFWKLDPNLTIKLDSDEDYYTKFREIFTESIKCRLRSAFSIGFDLSGGIDSSSVVVTAKNILKSNNNLETFSLIFNEIKEVDERYYINKIVETGRINKNYIVGDDISPLNNIETILWYQDEPFETPNLAMDWKFYKKVKEKNIRIMISGYDGDSVLYKGESYLKELAIHFKWLKLIQEINDLSIRYHQNSFKILISRVMFPLMPKKIIDFLKFIKKQPEIGTERNFNKINDEIIRKFNYKKRYEDIVQKRKKSDYDSKKRHFYYLTSGTHQTNLEVMDKTVAAFSIDYRHPLLDKRLVEFCYAIPTYIKFNRGYGRMLARMGLSDLLPPEIQWRSGKTNFDLVFEKNLLKFERKRLEKLLYANKNIIKYVNCDEVTKHYLNYQKKGLNSLDIWKIALLSIWLDIRIKNHLNKNNQ